MPLLDPNHWVGLSQRRLAIIHVSRLVMDLIIQLLFYSFIKRTYSIVDFAEYRRELIAHPITWPRVPIIRPRVSKYIYRPHWTYRSYYPYNYFHFHCPPGPYEYRNDPYHWAYSYHPHLTKYRTEWSVYL